MLQLGKSLLLAMGKTSFNIMLSLISCCKTVLQEFSLQIVLQKKVASSFVQICCVYCVNIMLARCESMCVKSRQYLFQAAAMNVINDFKKIIVAIIDAKRGHQDERIQGADRWLLLSCVLITKQAKNDVRTSFQLFFYSGLWFVVVWNAFALVSENRLLALFVTIVTLQVFTHAKTFST